MIINDLDNFYLKQDEPAKSTFLAIRAFILNLNPGISEAYKYKLPFFLFKNKMFCYLWIQKKDGLPYIGFVDGGKMTHPALIQEKRKMMKILTINPNEDLPIETLNTIFKEALYIRK